MKRLFVPCGIFVPPKPLNKCYRSTDVSFKAALGEMCYGSTNVSFKAALGEMCRPGSTCSDVDRKLFRIREDKGYSGGKRLTGRFSYFLRNVEQGWQKCRTRLPWRTIDMSAHVWMLGMTFNGEQVYRPNNKQFPMSIYLRTRGNGILSRKIFKWH